MDEVNKNEEVLEGNDTPVESDGLQEGVQQEKEDVAEESNPAGPKTFERGNLTLICSACGEEETLEVGVKNGISFMLPTIEGAEVKFGCSKCKNVISLTFKESSEEDIKVGTQREEERRAKEEERLAELEKQFSELKEQKDLEKDQEMVGHLITKDSNSETEPQVDIEKGEHLKVVKSSNDSIENNEDVLKENKEV